jgi:hypothetical protein
MRLAADGSWRPAPASAFVASRFREDGAAVAMFDADEGMLNAAAESLQLAPVRAGVPDERQVEAAVPAYSLLDAARRRRDASWFKNSTAIEKPIAA